MLAPDGTFSIGSDGDGANWVARGPVDWNEVLQLGNRYFDNVIAAAHKPTWAERYKAWDALIKELKHEIDRFEKDREASVSADRTATAGRAAKQPSLTKVVSVYFLLSYRPGYELLGDPSVAARAKLAETAFALCAYRGEHGHYPEDLSELVPNNYPACQKTLAAKVRCRIAARAIGAFFTALARAALTI